MKKSVYLFLALLLPVCIFLFLRIFGRNEFAVEPLYTTVSPPAVEGCPTVTSVPYTLADTIFHELALTDSLAVLFFGALKHETANQFARVKEETKADPVIVAAPASSERNSFLQRCVFFLNQETDVVLVDSHGYIRGHYASSDRKDIDRLLTEVTIILKKY